jgi:RNase H-fold protein (predicted Holliday junction resolvase)
VYLCGIDPGREKFGVAVASGDDCGVLHFSAVVPVENLGEAISCVSSGDFAPLSRWRQEGSDGTYPISRVCLGDGTGSAVFAETLRKHAIPYEIIDEYMTTLAARKLYRALHPSWLAKIIPASLFFPSRSIDDLAAWAILKRQRLNRGGDAPAPPRGN